MIFLISLMLFIPTKQSLADYVFTFIAKWANYGSGDGELNLPRSIDVDSTGNVYVVDSRNHRIQKYDNDGNFIMSIGKAGIHEDGELNNPTSLAIDTSNYIYVADTNNHRIQVFDSNGNFIKKWGSYGAGDGQFKWPYGVGVDKWKNVYVADMKNYRIQKFNSNGQFVRKWGSFGTGDGQFKWPRDIDCDSFGNVYVADTYNQRIQKFDGNGNFLLSFGGYGILVPGKFDNPNGVAIDNSGNIFVADTDNERIEWFTLDGVYVGEYGLRGTGDGEFDDPEGVAVDNKGGVYVADTINHRVQKFAYINDSETPNANAGGPYTAANNKYVYEGTAYKFDASASTDDAGIRYYRWDWNNDGTYDTETSQPKVDYIFPDGPATHTIKLQVEDYVGNTDTDTTIVNVFNINPVPDAGLSQYIVKNTPIFFQGTAFDASADVPTLIYEWDFNWDGNNSNFNIDATGENVIHSYPNIGTYKVGLRVKDKDGGVGYDELTLLVLNHLPRAFLPNITLNHYGWSTPFVIQNLSTEDASITANFISRNGTTVLTKNMSGLKKGNSWSVNLVGEKALGKSFQGSVVLYSDQNIVAIVNEHSQYSSMAYEGINPYVHDTQVFLPNITRNYVNWTTHFIVQNLSPGNAKVQFEFYKKGSSTPFYKKTNETISPGQSIFVNLSNITQLGNFQGSVVVKSDQKIGAIVNEHNYNENQTMSYNGFATGAQSLFLPNITRNYAGWTTPFIIQNIGNSSSPVTVRFQKKGSSSSAYTITTPTIAPGGSYNINPSHLPLGSFQGSVIAESNGSNIVAICNEHSGSDSMAYQSIYQGMSSNYLPNITKNYFGWTTPFIVQNLDLEDISIDVYFYDKFGNLVKTINNKYIPIGASISFNPNNYPDLGNSFQGSVVIQSINDKKIYSVVNEHALNGQVMSYNGF